MTERNSCSCLRIISAKFLFPAMLVLSCLTFAEDEIIVTYHEVEDPGQNLFSSQNLALVVTFAFKPKRFSDLWPDYGYKFNAVKNNIDDLCASGIRNIDIGRSAIARTDSRARNPDALIALRIENDTDPESVRSFLMGQDFRKDIKSAESDNSADDSGTLTTGDMCRILTEFHIDSNALARAVIVTQHPLPVSERYNYRLLEEGVLAPGVVSE